MEQTCLPHPAPHTHLRRPGRHRERSSVSKWNNATLFDTEYHDAYLFAFDPKTGKQVARIDMPGNSFGAPMTYEVSGKQYIATPIGGGDQPAELVVLSLP